MRKRRKENGIALLISIFVLLLISVVAIAMIVASSTETSLAGNYRSSTNVYYAALAGLEEARGRLVKNNPDYVLKADAQFLPPPGTALAIGDARYILNPNAALNENMGNVLTLYPDNEYFTEFGAQPNPTRPPIASVSSNNAQGIPGPPFKWVRINAVSENSLGIDVDADGQAQSTTPLYYDGARFSNNPLAGPQVLEFTALAFLPNGSQKILQYLAAPIPLNLSFQAALTLDGNGVVFNTNTSDDFWVKGNDQYAALNCNPNPPVPAVTAVGFTNPADQSNITGKIPSGPPPAGNPDRRGNYTNYAAPTPDVFQVTPPANLTTVAGLNNLVQTITQLADVPPITPPGQLTDTNNFMPSAMSATNPMTIVVNGDLVINGWHHDGYGLLLVTGELTYDPDAFWHGIILVIGKGWFHASQGSSTGGHIEGALFIAQTVDRATGNPLSTLGPSQFDFTSSSLSHSGNNYPGIYYSNCWVQAAMPAKAYKILSFHEISQ
jgi:hypothetical protein